MPISAKKLPKNTSGPKQEPLEGGNYLARLVQVIDLGLQAQRPFQGKEKPPAYQVLLTYELGTEFCKDEEGNEDPERPRWISEVLNFYSLDNERAKSTKRIKALDPDLKYEGDFGEMVGLPCTVTIVTEQSKKDPSRTYVNVGDVTPPMKGIPVPELKNDPKVFSLDEPDLEVFNSLPDWIKDKIKNNLEFEGSKLEALLNGDEPKEEDKKETYEAQQEEDDVDNPY